MRPLLVLIVWSAGSLSLACSLCSNPINRATLGEEFESARVVVVGTLSNPRLHSNPIAGAGAGTTDLAIESVLKNDGALTQTGGMALPRYMPVPDPKNPPRYLIFFETVRDRLEPLQGVAVKSPALVSYLDEGRKVRAQGRVPALLFYARHLDHADEAIALDAFMEFAKSKDSDVGAAAARLDPALVRRLLSQPGLDADRTALFAFLLGCCGSDSDADALLRLTDSLAGERRSALDGVWSGYVALRPDDGWKRITAILADSKQPFAIRFAALRTIRMLQGWRGEEIKPQALAAYRHVVRDGDMADLAVEDLRRWKWWELTADIADQFGRPSHQAPIVQHCLIRYAVACPLPEARDLVERARLVEPDYVADEERAKRS